MAKDPAYRSVSLFTIIPDEPLPFHVAIYYKGSHVVYRKPGEILEVSKYNRFIYKRISKLYVLEEEYPKYEHYQKIKKEAEEKSLNDPALTIEQRFSNRIIHDMRNTTRDLFFSETHKELETNVKQVIEQSNETVQKVLTKPYLKIFDSITEKSSTIVAHSMRVSLLATYLGYQLGFVNPVSLEYIAAAGLLHDIGKTQINLSDDLDSDEDDSEIMKQHPVFSCQMINGMGFVPEEITRIILEHHEYRDGSGYPHGIRGPKMHQLSRVFIIANTFDNLITAAKGTKQERYTSAIEFMTNEMQAKLDPVLLPKAARLLSIPG